MTSTTDPLEAAVDSLLMPDTPEETAEAPVEEQPEPEDTEAEEVTATSDEADEEPSETDEAEDQPEPEAPSKYTVKVDGKEVEVTLDELMRGYSGQAYIQRGMQEVAEARKQAKEQSEALAQQQAAVIALVQEIQAQGVVSAPQPPDPELVKTDPFGYVEAKARYDQQVVQYQRQQAQFQQLQMQQAQAEQARQQEVLQEQARILKERIPEFADAKKAGELQRKLWTFGKEAYGLSDVELSGITDARVVQALYDAMRYRELRAGTAPVKKTEPPKTVKPAAKRPEPAQLARARELDRAKKSGKPEAFIDLLLQR